ncbi:MAG: hypothetical protein V3U32_06795 [Anaerolineales bacterium]
MKPESQTQSDLQVSSKTEQIWSSAHCHRRVQGIRVSSLDQVSKALSLGYQLQSVDLMLRYPEEIVLEIGNPEPPLCLCPVTFLRKAFLYLQEKVPTVCNGSSVTTIVGAGLHSEICICGPNRDELAALKQGLLEDCYQHFKINHQASSTPYYGKGIHRTRPISTLPQDLRRFEDRVVDWYAHQFLTEYRHLLKLNRLSQVYQRHDTWSRIADLGEHKIFVLTAGLALALGYMNSTGDRAVSFFEVHRQNDAFHLFRKRLSNEIYPEVPDSATYVIIDKAYTGKSILAAREQLIQSVGKAKIATVGLFPKSYGALKNLDFIVFAGHLLTTADILPRCSAASWHMDLLEIVAQRE